MVTYLAAIPISYSKCCIFDLYHSHDDTYSIENYVLPTVQEIVDLGVTMNNSVKFSKHIAKVTVKGHRMANLILKCFLSRDINSLVRAFTTYVRPRLEYCSVVCNPVLKKDIENLEKVQRRFTKILISKCIWPTCKIYTILFISEIRISILVFQILYPALPDTVVVEIWS